MSKSVARAFAILVATACLVSFAQSQKKNELRHGKKDSLLPENRSESRKDIEIPTRKSTESQILAEIQSGIAKGDVGVFAKHLGSQVYMSLKGSERGYFSGNQALYVLQDFFSVHRPISFTFSTQGEIENSPFATGRGFFIARGLRESAQVYVSLAPSDGRWVVAEFNIY
jgi:hypothetical protein